jgi:hypothetical protein
MRLLGLATLAILLGCASAQSPARDSGPKRETLAVGGSAGGYILINVYRDDGTTTARLDAPPAEVWKQLVSVYNEIGLSPDRLSIHDPAGRQIGATDLRIRRLAGERLSRWLECGHSLGVSKADNGQARITLESWLDPDGESTMLMTRLEGTARGVGTSTAPIRCGSNGKLEREILARLEDRLAEDGR